MPIGLAGRYGTIQAAIVRGDAPLLLSRPALKRLGAVLDFDKDRLCLFSGAVKIDLVSNAAGQYVLNVLDVPSWSKAEIHMVSDADHVMTPVAQSETHQVAHDEWGVDDNPNGDSGDSNNEDNLGIGDVPVSCPAPSPEGVSG